MKKLNEAVDRFAFRHPRFGIPNLMRVIVIGNVIVYLLSRLSNYGAILFLGFDWKAVLHGEIWRLVTFIFVPESSSPFTLVISLYFYYFIGSLLEREWGTPKFNLYYLSGMIFTIITGIIGGIAYGNYAIYGADDINMSMFLAFAALYPDMQILLFFIIPIKVKWLAIADLALFAVNILGCFIVGDFVGALLPIVALLNFLIFFWSDMSEMFAYRYRMSRHVNSHKTIQFKSAARKQQKKQKQQGYRHKCSVCGRTDADFPDLEFRYCSKCVGYHCFCKDHIYTHVHFTE